MKNFAEYLQAAPIHQGLIRLFERGPQDRYAERLFLEDASRTAFHVDAPKILRWDDSGGAPGRNSLRSAQVSHVCLFVVDTAGNVFSRSSHYGVDDTKQQGCGGGSHPKSAINLSGAVQECVMDEFGIDLSSNRAVLGLSKPWIVVTKEHEPVPKRNGDKRGFDATYCQAVIVRAEEVTRIAKSETRSAPCDEFTELGWGSYSIGKQKMTCYETQRMQDKDKKRWNAGNRSQPEFRRESLEGIKEDDWRKCDWSTLALLKDKLLETVQRLSLIHI